jgi:hypothetical protein
LKSLKQQIITVVLVITNFWRETSNTPFSKTRTHGGQAYSVQYYKPAPTPKADTTQPGFLRRPNARVAFFLARFSVAVRSC